MKQVRFTQMKDGTAEEFQLTDRLYRQSAEGLADKMLDLLRQMKGPKFGYQIDRYDHSLQSATRAVHDGADEETVVMTLLHDIGDVLAPENHSQVAAAILRPYLSEKNHWILLHHGLFQGYYYFHYFGGDKNTRDKFKDHEFYQACVDFCEDWDQKSFDPDFTSMTLEDFEPMVRRFFSKSRQDFA